jgi:hypothetical protein
MLLASVPDQARFVFIERALFQLLNFNVSKRDRATMVLE